MIDLNIKQLIVITIIIFTVGIVFGYFFSKPQRTQSLVSPVSISSGSTPVISENLPYQEITIPYLRSRNYDGRIQSTKKISESDMYTAYEASYDSDGLTINALLYVPKGATPSDGWPGVVFVHGYIPPQNYRTTQSYNSYVTSMASKGIAVFKIDLRGHDRSEGTAGGSYYSSDYVIDTLNAYSSLSQQDFINPSNISLWGHSMAGNIVLRSVVVHQNIPKAVIWAGAGFTYTDLQTFRIQDSSYRPPSTDSPQRRYRQLLFETHGEFSEGSEFWKLVPGTNFLDNIDTDFQLHHALNDSVVNIGYSRNLHQILLNKGLSSSFFEYSSGGHNLTGNSFNQAISASATFIKK